MRSPRSNHLASWGAAALLTVGLLGWVRPRAMAAGKTVPVHQAASVTAPAGPGLLLFRSEASGMERRFAAELRRPDVKVISLAGLESPEGRKFAIRETPTLLKLDAEGKEVYRREGPDQIREVLANGAASCLSHHSPRLKWVEETDPRAARVYRRFSGGREGVPDIFKAMSLRPDLMEKLLDLSEKGHFSDGYLTERTKERVATLVSSLNKSSYCTGSHASNLHDLGAGTAEITALTRGDIAGAPVPERERTLLRFARKLTVSPGEVADSDIQQLRSSGWKDEQIFEASFDVSLFALFNRMASTYGLEYPADGWKPVKRQASAKTATAAPTQ